MVKEDTCIAQSGECVEYIGLNSESCKRADRYNHMCMYGSFASIKPQIFSGLSKICAKYVFRCVINGYTLRVTQMNPQWKSFAWQIKTLA